MAGRITRSKKSFENLRDLVSVEKESKKGAKRKNPEETAKYVVNEITGVRYIDETIYNDLLANPTKKRNPKTMTKGTQAIRANAQAQAQDGADIIEEMEQKLIDDPNMTQATFFGLMIKFMRANHVLSIQVKELKTEVDTMRKDLNDLRQKDLFREVNEAKRGIIIRGLEEDPNDKESSGTTREKVKGLLDTLDAPYHIETVRRIPISKLAKEAMEKKKVPLYRSTLIRFTSPFEKYQFFSKLGALRNHKDLKTLMFHQEIPFCLRATWDELEKRAFEIRRDEGAKTRIGWKGTEPILQKKIRGEKVFKNV